MVYRIEISDYAEKIVDEVYEYLFDYVGIFGNPNAAIKFLREYEQALDRLKTSAESYSICEENKLQKLKIRKIHFAHLKYKIFYHVVGNVVIVDFLVHDSQDYENMV